MKRKYDFTIMREVIINDLDDKMAYLNNVTSPQLNGLKPSTLLSLVGSDGYFIILVNLQAINRLESIRNIINSSVEPIEMRRELTDFRNHLTLIERNSFKNNDYDRSFKRANFRIRRYITSIIDHSLHHNQPIEPRLLIFNPNESC